MPAPLGRYYQSQLVSPYVIEGTDPCIGKFVFDMRAGTVTTECSVFRGAHVYRLGLPELAPADPSIDLTTVPWDLTKQPHIYIRDDEFPTTFFAMPTQTRYDGRCLICFLLEKSMTKDTYNFENELGTLTLKINRIEGRPPAMGAVVKLKPSGVTHVFHYFYEPNRDRKHPPEVPLDRLLALTWERMRWSLSIVAREDPTVLKPVFYTDRRTGEHECVCPRTGRIDLALRIHLFCDEEIEFLFAHVVRWQMKDYIRKLALRRWRPKILVFAAGFHPRLGAASPLRMLDDSILRIIAGM